MNLLVAKSIPALAHLDRPRDQRLADVWGVGVRQRLPHDQRLFRETPWDWKNDLDFFRLGVLCHYLDAVVGLAYNEDQRQARKIHYTDPSDLFLNGVMDTKRGTCGNMAMVHVAVAWRLGWPVSLACVDTHHIARYDDGLKTFNIEATETGRGGFSSRPDEFYIQDRRLPKEALECGSDLQALKPRELLGVYLGLRARHMRDVGDYDEAEKSYLLARHLFPANRLLYTNGTWVSIMQSQARFYWGEEGSAPNLADVIRATFYAPLAGSIINYGSVVDTVFTDGMDRIVRK
jgi:hypothetical protein